MLHAWVSLLIFALCYALFVILPAKRSWTACLGGNLTPIGASANVVTLGILKKHGHTVSFRQFMGVGIPFTVATVLSACAFAWWTWGR